MFTVDNRFTKLIWYGPDTFAANLPNAARINYLRITNGSSYPSWQYGRPINSYGGSSRPIRYGDNIDVDANGITPGDTSTYFTIDNGTPPASGSQGSYDVQLPALAGQGSPKLFESITLVQKVTVAVTSTLPSGVSILAQLNGGTPLSLADLNTAIGNLTNFPCKVKPRMLRTDTTSDTTATITITTV